MNSMPCPVCLKQGLSYIYPYRKDNFPPYYKCMECDSLYLYPMPSQENLDKYYKSLSTSGSYSESMGKFRINSINHFLDLSEISNYEGNWLDFGCFDGFLLKRVRDLGAKVWGVEIQELARQKASLIADGKVFSEIKLLTGVKFDFISMKDSIEHLLDPDEVFREFSKRINPECKLFIQTPNATSLTSKFFRGRWPGLNSPEHTIIFSSRGLEFFLKRHGWVIDQEFPVSKKLSIGYVLHQLSNFGGFAKLARTVEKILPTWIKKTELTFIGGEFIILAHKV